MLFQLPRLPYKKLSSQQRVAFLALFSLILSACFPFLAVKRAEAAFTNFYVRFDRMYTGAGVSGTACAKTSTSGTEDKVVISFPTGWTISTTGGDWTVSTTNLPQSATAWPNIGSAVVSVSGQAVTWDAGTNMDLSAATLYCFNFVGANSTLGTAGSDKTGTLTTKDTGGTNIDTGTWATAVVASGGDQITVTATVSPTFSFSLGGSSDPLGTLSSSAVVSGAGTAVNIGTNAANGWVAWVKGANNASGYSYLNSTVASAQINRVSGATIDDATEDLSSATGYVLDVDLTTDSSTGTGTVTVDPEYNGNTTSKGGTISSTFQEIATSNGTTGGDVLTVIPRVKISSAQAAATDYTDTLTVVAAGNF